MSFYHTCYRNFVPEEVGKGLIDLYQSAFCVPEYFDLYHGIDKTNAILIFSSSSTPDHVIFYYISKNEATVLNELFEINVEYVEYLTKVIFNDHPNVHTIHINKLKCELENFKYPFKVWDKSQDIVVELTTTMAEYRSKLGKRTKANMSNYTNKLRREFVDFSFSIVKGKEIDASLISEIIEMNRSRMRSKKTTSAIDAGLENKIIEFSGKYGIVGTLRLNGRIAAGTICYEVGDHCYADVIAHDPAYNQYSIGQVCIYLTIQSLIERGRHAFHMLWGENEYKYRFLGVKQDIYFVSIYRSEAHKIMSAFKHVSKFRYSIMIKDILKKHAKDVQSRLPCWE